MKTLKVGSLFLLSLLWLGPTLGFAEPPEDGDRPGMEERMKRMHAKLNLTPEQEKRLKEHRASHRESGKKLWEAVREKREAMNQELAKANYDETKVRNLHAEMISLRNQMAEHRLQGILEVRKILTPEQFVKFQKMMEHRRFGKQHGKRAMRDRVEDGVESPSKESNERHE